MSSDLSPLFTESSNQSVAKPKLELDWPEWMYGATIVGCCVFGRVVGSVWCLVCRCTCTCG